jgi:hypothetical protein
MSGRGREVRPGASGENQGQENAGSTATDLRQLAMAKRARERKSLPQDGAPLDEQNRGRMESQLGGDLSDVRVHTGGESARAADDLNARAFTVGKNVHFGAGEFRPGTRDGDRLLAHELSHTKHGHQAQIARYAKEGEGGEAMADAEGAGASKAGDPDEKKADQDAGAAVAGLYDAGGAPGGGGQTEAAQVKKGETGIIIGASGLMVDVGGKPQEMKNGYVVEVQSAKPDQLHVKVFSGMGGAEAVIPKANFKPEPGVTLGDDDKPRDDVYADFTGAKLWDEKKGPTVDDVNQGYIADCYLNAAMMSVVTANQGAIKKAFSPNTSGASAYTVTLHKKNDKGDLEAASVSVDAMLPAQKKSTEGPAADPKLSYTGADKDKASVMLWPALMEKAYAQLVGGYEKAGAGGYAGDALEAITGQKAQNEGLPAKDSVLERFKQLKQQGKAVICGTLGSKENKKEKAFTEKDGTYKATLTTHEGESAEVVKNTLSIFDDISKHQTKANDDGAGGITGDNIDKGTISYSDGKVELTFKKDNAPDKPENLTADYQFRGLLDKALNVHAWHMYVFDKVDGDNLIFKNPWGFADPKPIPADKFLELFTGITSEAVPAENEAPPGAK